MSNLKASNVHMEDAEKVQRIINEFVKGGTEKLQVISDFDMTLTTPNDEYGPCQSCYNALDSSKFFPSIYQQKAEKLKDHYYAIEIDPYLAIKEKIPYMVEWWTKAHDLLIEFNLRKEWLPQIVKESRIIFRKGCDWLFQQLNRLQVPLLVFSAGIGDVIEETFKSRSKLYDNLKIVSNFIHFNDEGLIDGFEGELMHVFNKNENVIHRSGYFEEIEHRHNIILMGDSLGDLQMADGAICENILKIGFLNDKVDEFLERYKKSFDIVIVNDPTMSVPNSIIAQVCEAIETKMADGVKVNDVTNANATSNGSVIGDAA
ncbi:hypothetical protein HELRODRAFT_106717 [Helobdella robusta]|uniref:5'-nucleotidase n=1 Tax=Helobdella robusta TaxID=6412 RepID=T1EE42_HELRO|nr:hypothetical protein HELRODRAFT_106717 [Helobdella robusta]ESO02553.1 hypothetical protein HELRODRAFT_106717 [Helobdella robusta]